MWAGIEDKGGNPRDSSGCSAVSSRVQPVPNEGPHSQEGTVSSDLDLWRVELVLRHARAGAVGTPGGEGSSCRNL